VHKVCLAFSCFLLLAVLCISEVPSTLATEELKENTWTVLPEDEKKDVLACAAVDGKIYALCFNKQLKTVDAHIFDHQTNNWTVKTTTSDSHLGGEILPVASAVVGDKIYCWGYGIYGETILNNKVYSTSTNCWSNLTPSPNIRESPSVCVVNDKIYLIGGETYKGWSEMNPIFREMEPTGTVETYDPQTGKWETKQPMNKPVQSPISIAVESKIYVFGGGYLQVYDLQTSQWRVLNEYGGDTRYIVGGSTTGKNAPQKIYLFGLTEVQMFDPKTEAFVGNEPFPEHTSTRYPDVKFGNFLQSFGLAAVNDVFYLIMVQQQDLAMVRQFLSGLIIVMFL
jgi:N-acetylneuraminic acid mutarotase